MRRVVRRLWLRRRRTLALVLIALALAGLGYAAFTLNSFMSCRSFHVKSYPRSYPSCTEDKQSMRPKLLAVTGGFILAFVAGAAYLWTEEPAPASRRSRSRRR